VTGRSPDWDDERLDAAFRARAELSPPTPADLVGAVLDHASQPRAWNPRIGWLAAAAGVVILLGAVSVLREGHDPRLTVPGAAGNDSGGLGRAPTSAVAAALGDPVSVSDAIGIRDGDEHPDRELVVAGYLSPAPTLSCPFIPAGRDNPTHMMCPQSFQWLMERPEIVMTTGPDAVEGGPPKGPAIQPSFALVDPPAVPIPASGGVPSLPVVLVGHFHDRRAALCEAADAAACGRTFVVDRVAAVNGAQRMVTTVRRLQRFDEATKSPVTETPSDLEADVDRLVLGAVPGAILESRLLVTIDQVVGLEPALANDPVLSHWGDPTALMWLETVVDIRDGVAVPRTFALIDGTDWFAEITADGAQTLDRRADPRPSGEAQPVTPSADPTAFDSAPATLLGLDVSDVADVTRQRRSDSSTDRDEYALRAWYVGPNPDATCVPSEPVIHPPMPPCDEARHWLLDDPQQYGVEVGQLRRDPDEWPRVLNPIVPIDVPFDLPATWVDGRVVPQPVVVLGHFNDERGVASYHGSAYFVVDALAWTRERPVASLDATTLLTNATEVEASVLGRINAVAPVDAMATWATVVDASSFAALEPSLAREAPEFTTGRPVWIVRRLIASPRDGLLRLGVVSAYTADGGDRVWATVDPDAQADLATSLDLRSDDVHFPLIRVFDYAQQLSGVRSLDPSEPLEWQRAGPNAFAGLEFARGGTDREVAIRWSSGDCNADWRVRVRRMADETVVLEPTIFSDECSGDALRVRLVLEFAQPVDVDRIRTGDPCCG
jgi:hypothetical protein